MTILDFEQFMYRQVALFVDNEEKHYPEEDRDLPISLWRSKLITWIEFE
jgi:hypothetical protein